MDLKQIKNIEKIGVIFGIIAGSMLHFTYQLSGNNNFVALFSAVNESVWEHTKLFFFPVLFYLLVEWYFVKNKKTLLLAKVLEIFWGIIFIITFFYTYTGAFGIENFFLDIGSFIVAVIIGKIISYYIITSKGKWRGYIALHALVLISISLFYFVVTFYPPQIPLFEDTNTNTYGTNQ